MGNESLYNVGDFITYKDPYWGEISGTVTIVGYKGDTDIIVYGLETTDGRHSICTEKSILKRKSKKVV